MIVRATGGRDPLRVRQVHPAGPRPDRIDTRVLRDRADRARADRGPRSRVLRAKGHGHAGHSPRSSRSSSTAACIRPRRAVRAAGYRPRDRHRCLDRGVRAARRSCITACRTSSCVASPVSASKRSRQRARRGGGVLRRGVVGGASATIPGGSSCRRSRPGEPRLRRRLRCSLARVADPGTAVYRRGHGRPAPPPAPGRDRPSIPRPGTRSSRRVTRVHTCSSRMGRGQGRQRLGCRTIGAGAAADDRRTVLVRRPRPMPWGFAYAPRGPVARVGHADAIGPSPRPSGPAACRRPAGSATCASIPRSRPTVRSTPTGRSGRPFAPPAGDRHRPSSRMRRGSSTCRPTRMHSGATCARSGASTSTRHGPPGSPWSTRMVTDCRVLPDLPRDRGTGRVPDPRRIGLSRRLGGLPPGGRARLLFAQDPDGAPQARCSWSAAARESSSRTAG